MNAPVTRWGIVEAALPNASYRATPARGAPAASATTAVPLSRRIVDMIAYVASFPRRRMAMAELASLTDRELSDIGLSRSELRQVFRRGYERVGPRGL